MMEMETQQNIEPNPKKRKREHAPRTRIVVEIPAKLRYSYVPGSGPPPQAVHLLPRQDSTAYILDRILLPSPGPAADGKPLPKRMEYIVGWHDLPAAACVLVPAMHILEYVSPRVYEDWEWQMELEKEEERLRSTRDTPSNSKEKRKRRGRPPKNSGFEPGTVTGAEEGSGVVHPKKGVMDVTPRKNRLDDFASLSDEESSPSRQIERELFRTPFDMAAETPRRDSQPNGTRDSFSVEEDDVQSSNAIQEPLGTGYSSKSTAVKSKSSTTVVTYYPQFDAQPEKSANGGNPTFGNNGVGQTTEKTPKGTVSLQNWRAVHSVGAKADNSNNVNAEQQSPISFTPIARQSSLGIPQTRSPSVLPKEEEVTPNRTPRENDRPKASRKRLEKAIRQPRKVKSKSPAQPAQETEEVDWEVEGIEGMNLYDVEGEGLVRYFKVRWSGDWPPDQNPSWEPEYNLPAKLVHDYLKNPKRKKKSSSSKQTSNKKPALKQTILSWGEKKYKSVSEAFAGDSLDLDMVASVEGTDTNNARVGLDAGAEGPDELLLVEEAARPTKKGVKRGPSQTWNTQTRQEVPPVYR